LIPAFLLSEVEANRFPWQRPRNAGLARNIITKKIYKGWGGIALSAESKTRWWGTASQWNSLGFPAPRYRGLFNADEIPLAVNYRYKEIEPDYKKALHFVEKTKANYNFDFGANGKYFYPQPFGTWPNHSFGDSITVPVPSSVPLNEYYATFFHELSHWAEIRLKYKTDEVTRELIAEIVGCRICDEIGIPQSNNMAIYNLYQKEWARRLKEKRFFKFVCGKIDQTVDFLLGFKDET